LREAGADALAFFIAEDGAVMAECLAAGGCIDRQKNFFANGYTAKLDELVSALDLP
jgi:hypothetical protein